MSQQLLKANQTDKVFRAQSIARLRAEEQQIQKDLVSMYKDKIHGKVSEELFDGLAAEWSKEQERLRTSINEHEADDGRANLQQGAQLLELAANAQNLFKQQPPSEKRRLLKFVVSNSILKEGVVTVNYRQPFDLIAHSMAAMKMSVGSVGLEKGQNEEWLLR